jgi:hypothetical protein
MHQAKLDMYRVTWLLVAVAVAVATVVEVVPQAACCKTL